MDSFLTTDIVQGILIVILGIGLIYTNITISRINTIIINILSREESRIHSEYGQRRR